VIWIGYTTEYRTGGRRLKQAAETLAREAQDRGDLVKCQAVETKRDFVQAMAALTEPLAELHLVCHAGMYGPMFGTTDMPEQFSPHEWRQLDLKFSDDGEVFVHACRSGRWFAPFLSRTLEVPVSGFHWYTTVSRRRLTYRWVPSWYDTRSDIWVVGQPGRKSHGLMGSLGKHAGWTPPEPMLRFEPRAGLDHPAYDDVAGLYDAVFEDIRVRGTEWEWIQARVGEGARVLDVGCGTGALLRALKPHIAGGAGVDVSGGMLEHARRRDPSFEWCELDGPDLPFDDDSFDVVTSLLSWRYLDWDPMLLEIMRVLRPGGRLLIVDMVAKPASLKELPTLARHKVREAGHARRFRGYNEARQKLVSHPAWKVMLQYNPIRAEHEYRWYLQSRFAGSNVQTLDIARNTRVLAFDSGPVEQRWLPPQSYP
jgi:ubiquinone/menaquinone biosynthesis C-methylase UbiE